MKKNIFVQLLMVLVVTFFMIETAETGEATRRKNNVRAKKAKQKVAARCSSGARYGQLANSPPRYAFRGGVDRRVNPAFKGYLGSVSSKLKRGLTLTSGYRDCNRNRKVGGASKSAHLTGNAVDVSGASVAHSIQKAGIARGQTLFNNCNNHTHLALDRSGYFSECGGKGKYKRKKERKKSKWTKKKRPRDTSPKRKESGR